MLKKIFIGGGIFILLLINLPYLLSFYDNYNGQQLFEQKKYDLAKDKFTQANNVEGIYDIGNTLYKQGKYEDSIKTYLSILGTGKNELNFRLNHNLGNAYYRFGEKQTNINLKKGYWEKAVTYYQKALKIKYDEQTKDNLEFVLNKLKDLKNQKNNKQQQKQQNKNGQKKNNQQQSQKQNGQKKNSQNKQGQGKKQENKNGKKNGNEKSDEKTRGDQMKNKQDNKNKQNSSASSEKTHQNSSLKQKQQAQMMKALQEYQKNLKLQQKRNMQNYGKVYQPPRSNDPFDDPFFTGMPRQDNVKDW